MLNPKERKEKEVVIYFASAELTSHHCQIMDEDKEWFFVIGGGAKSLVRKSQVGIIDFVD